jgi:DNA-binding transcriptional LysR family regulator
MLSLKTQPQGSAVDWDLYRFFITAAEAGSLLGAAELLHVSEPTVGRKIKELETKLGFSLFLRSTRGLVLTQAGRYVFDRVSVIETGIAELHRLAARSSEAGASLVRLSTSEGIGQFWISGLLCAYFESYPHARVEIVINNRSIDLNNGEADVALRLGSPGSDSLFASKVANVSFGFYASRDYIEKAGMPKNDAELAAHRFIRMSGVLSRFQPAIWMNNIIAEDGAPLSSDSLTFNHLAAESGLGIVMLACIVTRKLSKLIRIPTAIKLPVLPLWVVTHAETRKMAGVKALVQYIREQAERDATAFEGLDET